MSEVRLVVRDAESSITGHVHGAVADYVVGALSTEPETLAELKLGLERFSAEGGDLLKFLRPGDDDEPHDAGVVVIDLAARLVAWESTWAAILPNACLAYHDGSSLTEIGVRYHLPDDWLLSEGAEHWRPIADARRRERSANARLDARAVLYGRPMLEFVVARCQADFAGVADDDADDPEAAIRQIHADWLTTPRDDLRGRAPRDLLLEKHDFIGWDMQDRCEQWSAMLRPPRPLDPESAAYRFAGFGTHEIVTYYELVRDLIRAGRTMVVSDNPPDDPVAGLEMMRERLLDLPDPEFGRRTPRELIENERRRMPEASTDADAMIDDDCPLCQLQAEMPGVGFWHLDGCNMDPEFAFSFHRTREEYDAEQAEWEEFDRRFEARQEERKRLGLDREDATWYDRGDEAGGGSASPFVRLFRVGARLCKITAALKVPAEDRPLLDRLSRDYGNLRDVVQGPEAEVSESLIQPVLDRFCESLDVVAAAHPDLADECAALQNHLSNFLAPPAPEDDESAWDDDVPY